MWDACQLTTGKNHTPLFRTSPRSTKNLLKKEARFLVFGRKPHRCSPESKKNITHGFPKIYHRTASSMDTSKELTANPTGQHFVPKPGLRSPPPRHSATCIQLAEPSSFFLSWVKRQLLPNSTIPHSLHQLLSFSRSLANLGTTRSLKRMGKVRQTSA